MYVPTQFADESGSGLSALGIDGHAFIIQLITFVLAYLVLRRYAFGPILKVMNERRATIESGVKLGEQMQKERLKLEAEIEDKLHQARQEADGILASAQDNAREAIREAEDKARQKAAGILAEAEAHIEQDTARARQQLEGEVADLVAEATGTILHEKIDTKKDAQLIERALQAQKGRV